MIKSRKPFAALLLSFFPGLGQIYNGQLIKGLIILLIDLLLLVLLGISGALLNMSGLVIMLMVAIAFVIYRMADGFIVAKGLKDYELKPMNKWYIYFLFWIVPMVIRGTFLDFSTATRIQTFKVISPSMNPTLQIGDRVVAQLNAYNNSKIGYGDIVAFNSPERGIWTFRVIGLPSDSIEIINGYVYINGQRNEIRMGQESISDNREVIEFEEKLKNNKKIRTFRFKNNSFPESRTMAKRLIPKNEYFLMGDNRDNSLDSRFIGTVKKEDILGRVIYSFWGNSRDRVNVDLRLE